MRCTATNRTDAVHHCPAAPRQREQHGSRTASRSMRSAPSRAPGRRACCLRPVSSSSRKPKGESAAALAGWVRRMRRQVGHPRPALWHGPADAASPADLRASPMTPIRKLAMIAVAADIVGSRQRSWTRGGGRRRGGTAQPSGGPQAAHGSGHATLVPACCGGDERRPHFLHASLAGAALDLRGDGHLAVPLGDAGPACDRQDGRVDRQHICHRQELRCGGAGDKGLFLGFPAL